MVKLTSLNPQSQNLAAAMSGYTPNTAQAIRRSDLLAKFLEENSQQSQQIRSPGELAARLLAQYVASRGQKKADQAALEGWTADRKARADAALGAITGLEPAPALVAPQAPPTQPVAPQPQPTTSTSPPAPASVPADSKGREALARAIWGEARGEGQKGMEAVGSVIMNRLKKGHGGAKTLADVIFQPKQFEAMTGRAASMPLHDPSMGPAVSVADRILAGQVQDPTGGAVNFLNPDLQAKMGRPQPAWAPAGQGQRIGSHVFYGGSPQAPQTPQMPPADAQFTGGPPPAQPIQLAANGPIQPGMMPQQGSPPPSAGGQPGAAPISPQGAALNPGTWRPTPQQVELVKQLLASPNPGDYDRGMALVQQIREKMATPPEYDVQNVNGVPYYVPKTPGQGQMQSAMPGGLPPEVMNQTLSAQQAGIPAAPGTMYSRSPTGQIQQVYAPPEGFQQGLGGQQSYVQGGPRDPAAGMNLVNNEQQLRGEYGKLVAPYIAAREGYQKVVQAANTGTPAGDIALVFGYMKTLDPTSTVREGEQSTVQNSGTIPQTVANMYNRLLTGQGRLAPEQRAQFVQSAYNQLQSYKATADQANERYGQLAKSYGFDPSRIVQQFSEVQPYEAPRPEKAQAPEAARQTYRNLQAKGALDTSKPFGDRLHPFVAVDDAAIRKLDRPENVGKFVVFPDGSIHEITR